MKKVAVISMVAMLIAGALTVLPNCSPAAPEPAMPSVLVITTTGVGSTAHVTSSILGEAFTAVAGIPTRILPHATDSAGYTALRDGDAHFRCGSAVNGWGPMFGIEDFKDWGPQPIYMVWQGGMIFTGMSVKASDTGIKTIADLRGKRIQNVPGMASFNIGRNGHLAFAGLTANDVRLVDCASLAAAQDAQKLGNIDACGPHTITSSGAMDIASSLGGIRWLPMPASDTVGWERLAKVAPYVPAKATRGAAVDPSNPPEVSGLPSNTFSYGTKFVSEQLGYLWAKALHTQYNSYKDKQVDLPGFTLEQALNFRYSPYPYHPGAIKYFKELGAWTKDHQSWQDGKVADMEARLKAVKK